MKTLDRLRIPVIQGGMGVGISMGNLAGHVALEGGMGVISTADIGFREKDFLTDNLEANKRALIREIKKARDIAEGNGLIAINAMVVTGNYAEMVKTACEAGIDAVISGAGLPLALPEIVKEYKVMIAPIVSGCKAAAAMIKKWGTGYSRKPDFIVVEGSEAGGHLGFKEEELLSGETKKLAEIVREVCETAGDIPVFAAGGVFEAEDIKELMAAGAYGVQLATRFIATEECDATEGFKKMIIDAKEEDIVIIKSPVGMSGRAIRSPLIDRIESGGRIPPESCVSCVRTCKPSSTPYCLTQALISAYYGDSENGLFFCGAKGGKLREMTTVKKLMTELSAVWE